MLVEVEMRGSTQVMVLVGTKPYIRNFSVRLLWYRAAPWESCSTSVGKKRWLSLPSRMEIWPE